MKTVRFKFKSKQQCTFSWLAREMQVAEFEAGCKRAARDRHKELISKCYKGRFV